MSYYIIYAGETSEEHGLLVYQRPNLQTTEETISTYDIPGRETNLVERSGSFKPVEIDVVLNYASTADNWAKVYRDAVLWLRKSGDLQFSDDLAAYRKVLYVSIEKNARSGRRIGKFTATFVCKPGIYLADGANFQTAGESIENPYSECRPVWLITGNGACTLTVNGNSMTAAVTDRLYIDTDLKIAYRSEDDVTNTAVSGDYDGLILAPGENAVSLTGSATLQVQTNFRVM